MKIAIADIVINERVRTDLGDLKPLMASLEKHGQLNPVTVSRQNDLIAGHRRTLAAKQLGWKYIEAHIVDTVSEADKLYLELEENVHRKDFSPEELLAGYKKLEQLLKPKLTRRIGQAIKGFFFRLFGKRPVPKDPALPISQSVGSAKTESGEPGNYGV